MAFIKCTVYYNLSYLYTTLQLVHVQSSERQLQGQNTAPSRGLSKSRLCSSLSLQGTILPVIFTKLSDISLWVRLQGDLLFSAS